MWCKQLPGSSFWNTVWQREFQILAQELFDVRTLHVVGLFNFNNFEDLPSATSVHISVQSAYEVHTWIDLNRARCLAAMSW